MNQENFSENSDSSDEDYVPETKIQEIVSEEDSDGDPEEPFSDDMTTAGGKRRKCSSKKKKKKPKCMKTQEGGSIGTSIEDKVENNERNKEDIDDIWADFMKDTGFQPKNSKNETTSKKDDKTQNKLEEKDNKSSCSSDSNKKEKVKVTQVFQFAGEVVTVEKEVPKDSAEARLLGKDVNSHSTKAVSSKRTGLSGISNVLSQLGKKPKISTLEKTKLDWDKFKKEENIEEELKTYVRGKDGYLDKQDFLERADLRRFEIEKEARSVERSKRMNNL